MGRPNRTTCRPCSAMTKRKELKTPSSLDNLQPARQITEQKRVELFWLKLTRKSRSQVSICKQALIIQWPEYSECSSTLSVLIQQWVCFCGQLQKYCLWCNIALSQRKPLGRKPPRLSSPSSLPASSVGSLTSTWQRTLMSSLIKPQVFYRFTEDSNLNANNINIFVCHRWKWWEANMTSRSRNWSALGNVAMPKTVTFEANDN